MGISNKLEIVIPLFQPNSSRLNRISSFKKSGTYLERDKKNSRRMAQCLRLICFLTIVVLVFVDIYCTFRAVWTRFVPMNQDFNLQNIDEKYYSLWKRCRQGTSLNEMCDNYGSRISGTGSGKVLAWRSLMMITVIELIFAASCCLLSLECVLLTQRKKLMAISTGILCLTSGLLMMIVCIWNTAEMLVTLDQNLLSASYNSDRFNRDSYKPTPGEGLVLSYLSSVFSIIVAAFSFCWAEEDDVEEDMQSVGTRRPSMPMSMLSGYPNTKFVPNPQPTVYMSDPRQSGGNMDADGYI